MSRLSWERYAIRLADAASARSEDPWHRVGACVLRPDHTVAAVGYNGAPPGVEIDWSNRDARRAQVLHAEANALRYVTPGEADLLAATMMPCANCVLLAASYGIKRIVYRDELDPQVYDIAGTKLLAITCGISVTQETT